MNKEAPHCLPSFHQENMLFVQASAISHGFDNGLAGDESWMISQKQLIPF